MLVGRTEGVPFRAQCGRRRQDVISVESRVWNFLQELKGWL